MRKLRTLIPLLVTLALLFANAPTAQAYCNTYDNGLGGQSGTCNGERINTYDNGLGGVSGTIGKSRVNTYNNGLGGVSGSGIGGVPGITKSNKKCVSTFTKKC